MCSTFEYLIIICGYELVSMWKEIHKINSIGRSKIQFHQSQIILEIRLTSILNSNKMNKLKEKTQFARPLKMNKKR